MSDPNYVCRKCIRKPQIAAQELRCPHCDEQLEPGEIACCKLCAFSKELCVICSGKKQKVDTARSAKSALCTVCLSEPRISAGLRVCKCGKAMDYGEFTSCTDCAKKNGSCKWCACERAEDEK